MRRSVISHCNFSRMFLTFCVNLQSANNVRTVLSTFFHNYPKWAMMARKVQMADSKIISVKEIFSTEG